MITVVKQDSDLGDVEWLRSEVIDMLSEHLNQTSIIGHVSWCAVCKERKSQCIDSQMSLDAVGSFVEAKALGFNASIASVFHGL